MEIRSVSYTHLDVYKRQDYNLANAAEKLEIERLAGLFENGTGSNINTCLLYTSNSLGN